MSSIPPPSGSQGPIPGLEPGPGPAPAGQPWPRQALGLPAGSVRAILALMVLAMLWIIALLHADAAEAPRLFVYLLYLFILILASYFASHGTTIGAPQLGQTHPLRLPRGTVRLVLLIGFAGLLAWLHWYGSGLAGSLTVPSYMPFILLGSFLLGYLVSGLVRKVSGRSAMPALFQDVLAWISLMAIVLLAVALLAEIIKLGLPGDLKFDMPRFEAALAGVIGFYFGARS